MNDFWLWLIGAKRSPDWAEDSRWRLALGSWPEGAWAVGAVALAVGAAAGVWLLYRWEGRNLGRGARLLLAGLRLGALAVVALMLLDLLLVVTHVEHVRSKLLVLVDESESMSLADPYADEATARTTAERLDLTTAEGQPDADALRHLSRFDLARRALGDLLEELGDGRQVELYGFADRAEHLDDAEALAGLRAGGRVTAVGEALKQALAAERGQPLAGVLLVSDGQSNAGEDPRPVALAAGKDGVLVHSLAVGTEQGPANARLVDLEVSPVVFVRDPTELAVLVEGRGLEGHAAVVSLEERRDGGAWQEIGREEVLLGGDATVRRVTFKYTPEQTGAVDFRAAVGDVGPELSESDNTAAATIKVVRQKVRVLLIAGYPSPEVQFIRNALLRDPALEFASWLQSAGDGYEQIGAKPLRRLPANRQELEYYDVVVLFDPDMRSLGPAWGELFTQFVGDAGGGLVYVAGELNSQTLFGGREESASAGAIDSAWLRILPVTRESGLVQSQAEVQLSARETWNLELTPEGAADSIFRFVSDPKENREVLASLPGMYWHFPVTRAKPGATVLARHGDPRMHNSFGRHVLLATQRYGPGRTVFVGFDSTYRWRYLHEEYFDGFWARLVDRIGRAKVLGGRYPFTLAADKSVYRVGDQVKLRAELVHAGEDATPITALAGEVEVPGQAPLAVEFEPVGDGAALAATLPANEPGTYLLRVVPASGPEAETSVRAATLSFAVEAPRQEIDRPTLNRALLDEVARAGGGRVFSLADYRAIPAAFTTKRVERVSEVRDELWDAPLLCGGLVMLLTIEWVLRKKWRMA